MTKLLPIPNSITDFHDEYYWLDNMWLVDIRWNTEITFNSVEQGFVYFKTRDAERRKRVLEIEDPYKAKAYGREEGHMRNDWHDIRVAIMRQLVERKFRQHQDLMKKLLNTGDLTLVEGNTWHDNIWGVCVCSDCAHIRGQNFLGFILMALRVKIREEG